MTQPEPEPETTETTTPPPEPPPSSATPTPAPPTQAPASGGGEPAYTRTELMDTASSFEASAADVAGVWRLKDDPDTMTEAEFKAALEEWRKPISDLKTRKEPAA